MFDSDKDFTLLKQQVQTNCRFVRNVSTMTNDQRIVYVELVEELHESMPKERWTLEIERDLFSCSQPVR